jgi:hypothetical protein
MSTTIPGAYSSQGPAGPSSSTGEIRLFNRPSYLLLTTAGTIFVSEVLVMMILKYLPPLASFQEAIFDAALLSITVFPSLYFFIFKPLNQHITQHRRAEAEKDSLIAELHKALDEVKTLRGIVPICSSCKKIRDDDGFWQQVEIYVSAHSDAMFSHGICPECVERLYPDIRPHERTIESGKEL